MIGNKSGNDPVSGSPLVHPVYGCGARSGHKVVAALVICCCRRDSRRVGGCLDVLQQGVQSGDRGAKTIDVDPKRVAQVTQWQVIVFRALIEHNFRLCAGMLAQRNITTIRWSQKRNPTEAGLIDVTLY